MELLIHAYTPKLSLKESGFKQITDTKSVMGVVCFGFFFSEEVKKRSEELWGFFCFPLIYGIEMISEKS